MNFQDLIKELALLGYFELDLSLKDNMIHFNNNDELFINDELSLYEVNHEGRRFELCIVESVDDVIFYIEENQFIPDSSDCPNN